MENDDFTIRFADVTNLTEADYETLAALSRAAFSEYKKESDLNFRGVTMKGENVRAQAEKGTRFVIICKDGEPIAYGGSRMIHKDGHTYMHGEGLACHPAYRRHRLGWRIAQLKEDWGREQGAEFFDLDTSCKAAQAIAFHKKNDYKVWGYTHWNTTNYYSVIMQKDVTRKRSEWKRYKSIILSWLYTHMSYNEAGEPRRFGLFIRRAGGYLLRLLRLR